MTDTGPLIAFGRIGRLDILPAVLGDVLVPRAVLAECLREPDRPGASAIRQAVEARLLQSRDSPQAGDPLPLPNLDEGETAAIRFAMKLGAPVLMDEKTGRKVAKNLGLVVIGSGGVLLAAKKKGIIGAVKPLIESFRQNGYHLSELLTTAILTRANEK